MYPKPIIITTIISLLFIAAIYFIGESVFESRHVSDSAPPVPRPTKPIRETNTPPPSHSNNNEPKRENHSIEEILANGSPEFQQKYAELVAKAKAYAAEQARKQALNPTAEDIEINTLRKEIQQMIADREAELAAEEDEFEQWEKAEQQYNEELSRRLEEAKQFQAESEQKMKRWRDNLKRRGLWDYKNDRPKTTQ